MAQTLTKCGVVITAILILGGGVATILVAAIALRNPESKIFVGSAKTAKNAFIATMIAFGSLLCILGIAGIYGSLRRNKCILTIYIIGIIIFFFIFATIGIVGLLVFTNKWIPNINDEISCIKQDWLDEINKFVIEARQNFCTSACPCQMDDKIRAEWESADYQSKFATKPAVPVIKNDGVVRIQDCQNFDISSLADYEGDYVAALVELEKNIYCSGICQKIDIYMFSDINAGLPYNGDCLGKIISYFKKYSREIGGICLGIAGILLLNIIFSFYICCYKKDELEDQYLLKD